MKVLIGEFFKRTLTALFLIFVLGGAYLHSQLLFSFVLCVLLALGLVLEWPRLICFENKIRFFILSFFYPVLPVVSLIALNYFYRHEQFLLPIYPFFVAWTADTCGYIFGKRYGKHRMCPSISPGKTWEGFFGSFLGVLVLNLIIFSRIPAFEYLTGPILSVNFLLLIPSVSLALTTISFLGGLFISYLKRRKALKDAGNIFPGHGGVFDRFDSVFFMGPATWAMILYAYLR